MRNMRWLNIGKCKKLFFSAVENRSTFFSCVSFLLHLSDASEESELVKDIGVNQAIYKLDN